MAGLRDYLQAVYEKHGQLTADILVQEARPKTSPAHAQVFDKSVSRAAEEYYRERAAHLIRDQWVVYQEADENGAARKVRAWQIVRAPDGVVYEPVEKVAATPIMAAMVLSEMKREYRNLESRFGHMQEFVQLAQKTVKRVKVKA